VLRQGEAEVLRRRIVKSFACPDNGSDCDDILEDVNVVEDSQSCLSWTGEIACPPT
jgi:hypothetical protein